MSTTAQTSAEISWQEFRSRRDERLAAPYGILAQVGLHWIDPAGGAQEFDDVPGRWEITGGHLTGTWEDDALTLLAGAPDIEVHEDGSRTRATVVSEDDVRLASYGDELRFDVIRRGDRLGLRLLDPHSPRLTAFDGVPTFPYDPALVITGTWRREPGTAVVGSAFGWLEQSLPSPGVATLDIGGTSVEVVLTDGSNILFTDETSGTESADWRVVTAVLDGDSLSVDLNRAVNFPSAFSAWGTCPKPPAGNHLPLAVRAGERRVEQTPR